MKTHTCLLMMIIVGALLVSASSTRDFTDNSQTIRVATWNIEHLGSSGRGLGGIGAGNLPLRTDDQLQKIAFFIRDGLRADLLAIQEVAETGLSGSTKLSAPLEKITGYLGPDWSYRIGSSGRESGDPKHNMRNAFVWNKSRVRAIQCIDFSFPNEVVGDKRLFDRSPLLGYFEIIQGDEGRNDFLLVNVHLTSGQNNDENHLTAMVILEQNLKHALKDHNIKESDRIILGDFNDNPYATKEDGSPRYLTHLYEYMKSKKYGDLVTKDIGPTRMDSNLSSTIDHILINSSARRHFVKGSVYRFMPGPGKKELAQWRNTFSDHFPVVFELKIEKEDDDVD